MQSQIKSWLIILPLLLATPVHAADKATWEGLAQQFGCANKVSEQHAQDDSFYMAQYIPANEKKDNWTRIFTVQLFRAPAEQDKADEYILGLINQVPQNIESTNSGDVTVWQSAKNSKGRPVAYGEFFIAGEHTVTVIYPAATGVVAVNQFAVRKARLASEEKQLLANLVGANIKKPAAKAEPESTNPSDATEYPSHRQR